MKERTARGTAIVNLLPLQPDEQIQAIIDTRDYETSRYLFFATKQGPGEEDDVHRVRLVAAATGSSPSTCATATSWCRSSRPTASDDIFMVSRHGHDHPLHRGRRAADGPRRGRRARHEAAGRATRSCRATSPATTPPS